MRSWLLGIATVLAAAGVSVADEKATMVIKKGIEAHGGADNLNKYTAGKFTMKGEVSVQGMDLEFSGDMAYTPDKYRMNLDMQVMGQTVNVRQIMAGNKGSRTVKVGDMVVQKAEVEEEEIKMALAGREAQRLTPLLDAKQFTIRAADDEDVNGKKAAVVVATPKVIDKEIKLWFDKESGLLVKTGHKSKGPGEGGAQTDVYAESYVSDYKKVSGIQVSTKIVLHHDGKKFMTATMSDVEQMEKLDDKEFKLDD